MRKLELKIPEHIVKEMKEQTEREEINTKLMINKMKSDKLIRFYGGQFISSVFTVRRK